MARFDVFSYESVETSLVVDVQADLLSGIKSVVVVPLLPFQKAESAGLKRLHPEIIVDGNPYRFMTTDIGAIPRIELGKNYGNLENDYRDTIIDALDFLFKGF